MNPPLKLHLGCGQRKIHGWINVDIRPEVQPDRVDDVFELRTFNHDSADIIYACHVLEHGTRDASSHVLRRWFNVLRPGGVIRVAVPDLAAAFEWYHSTGRLSDILGLLYGGQRDSYDQHGTGWDQATLVRDLAYAGFTNIHGYDWRQTDHFYVDDYASCALPAITYRTRQGEQGGKAMSLNMEATKP